MKIKNKVCVIIPVYNVEIYLKRCINSVINQTYKNIEIILVDDGSTDSSGIMCDEFQKCDNRIKVFHKINGGLGSARNYGFEKSTCEYILFLDSDDYIELDTIEVMINSNLNGDYDIVCCGFDRVDELTSKIYSTEMISMSFDELIIDDKTIMETAFLNPSGWGKLYKRSKIEKFKFSTNKKSIEDILFYLQIIPTIKKIKYLKRVLWHYTVRKNSLISSITLEKAIIFENDLLQIKKEYIEKNYNDYYINYLMLQVIIHNCISIPSRIYINKEIDMKKHIAHVKNYMDKNFSGWKNIRIEISGNRMKKTAIYAVIFLYRLKLFKLFLITYNFMIKRVKIDVKW